MSLYSIINNTGKRFDHFENVAFKFCALDPKHFDIVDILADMYSDVKSK